jgi:hypothetical protein
MVSILSPVSVPEVDQTALGQRPGRRSTDGCPQTYPQ